MASNVKVNGVWKSVTTSSSTNSISVKVGGIWKSVSNSYTKVNGTWKQWLTPYVAPPTPAPSPSPYVPSGPYSPYVAPPTVPYVPWPQYYYTGYGSPPAAPNPGGYCLDKNSLVSTPNGKVAIKDIKVGDIVMSSHFTEIDPTDPNGDLVIDTWSSDSLTFESAVTTTVVNMWEWSEQGQYVFNGKLKTTKSQPLITKDINDGRYYYTRAYSIVVGDHVFDEDSEGWVPVTDIKFDPEINFDVKILDTSPYNMFFAEGTLVHNK
jgi:hypothetical protein